MTRFRLILFLFAVLALACWVFVAPTQTQGAWTSQDIGAVGSAGSCTNVGTTYTVVGDGTTFGTADSFHFCHQLTSGDREITAQVTSNTTNGGMGGQETGLMVRQNLTAGSPNVECNFGDVYTYAEWRQTQDGTTDSSAIGPSITTGYVRMRVISGVASCDVSSDGANWTAIPVGASPVFTGSYYVGMKEDGNSVGVATGIFVNPSHSALTVEDTGGLRPHFRGFGTACDNCAPLVSENRAGRGGEICIVNSLSGEVTGLSFGTSGTRSFGDCTSARAGCDGSFALCARIVLFEISGVVCLDDTLDITSPYLTIAGQTAPSPGISIRCAPIHYNGHDLLFQHSRIRADTGGNFGVPPDGMSGGNPSESIPLLIGGGSQWTYNIVLDHISVAFANGYMSIAIADSELGLQPNPWDVSTLDSIIAWPLSVDTDSIFLGYGIGNWPIDNGQGTFARNLILHVSHRGIYNDNRRGQTVNNFMYGSGFNDTWGAYLTYGVTPGGACAPFGDEGPECKIEIVGINNRFIGSSGTGSSTPPRTDGSEASHSMWYWQFNSDNVNLRGDRVWLSGNDGENETGSSGDGQLADVHWADTSFTNAQIGFSSPPSWHTTMGWTPIATASLHTSLTNSVGARPADRDVVDALAVTQMNAAAGGSITGSRIRAPGDLGLNLTLASNTHTLSIPANPHTVADAAGRTNIEIWLESLAKTVEDGVDVNQLLPASGNEGTSVTISGTGFGGTQGPGTVKFNGVTATVTSWTATSITTTVPVGATTGPVTVTQLGLVSNADVTFTLGVGPPDVSGGARLRFRK